MLCEGGTASNGEALAACAVYLEWVSTGAVQCVEGGGHYRPNRHAELSREIFRALERNAHALDDGASLAARRVHPWLPAFTAEFTQSVPLTRIRDIAHRSDIPHDLKQEIKHTIQNKLHRNAGPEDLVATEKMLERILNENANQRDGSHGPYPQAFVDEFKTFYAELKDFFNAGGVEESLANVCSEHGDLSQYADPFLGAKRAIDSNDAPIDAVLNVLEPLANLRGELVGRIGSFNIDDDGAAASAQKMRLLELGLETYAFVVASRALGMLGVGEGDADVNPSAAPALLRISASLINHVSMAGYRRDECAILSRELEGLASAGQVDMLAAVGASQRCRRVLNAFTEDSGAVFGGASDRLGRALGIPDNTYKVFHEASIRAHVAFPASRAVSALLKIARTAPSNGDGGQGGGDAAPLFSPFDVLVSGNAEGKLLVVPELTPEVLRPYYNADGTPYVLLVARASGDEEVASSYREGSTGADGMDLRIQGVVLQQELPHLSHLGVRARQERVVFATCTDDSEIAKLKELDGSYVSFVATPDGVDINVTSEPAPAARAPAAPAPAAPAPIPAASPDTAYGRFVSDPSSPFAGAAGGASGAAKADLTKAGTVVPLVDAVGATCGQKSANCAQMLATAAASNGLFDAPGGCALPYGTMQVSLEAAGKLAEFEQKLSNLEGIADALSPEFQAACEDLRAFVEAVEPPASLVEAVAKAMPVSGAAICRSSANVEDLEGMSAAGLYDSLACDGTPAGLATAIRGVWASLYTHRACVSRWRAGVGQSTSHMAILVQPLLNPAYSFVLHTSSPLVAGDDRCVHMELAVGLGETLASGAEGTPYRIEVDKADPERGVKTLALSSLSYALRPGSVPGKYDRVAVDYSNEPLTKSSEQRNALGAHLCRVGVAVENAVAGGPQDIEGCFVMDGQGNGTVYVVQTRPFTM